MKAEANDDIGGTTDDDTGNNQEGNRNIRKQTAEDSKVTPACPPNDDETLGHYIENEDDWLKPGVTDKQKKTARASTGHTKS